MPSGNPQPGERWALIEPDRGGAILSMTFWVRANNGVAIAGTRNNPDHNLRTSIPIGRFLQQYELLPDLTGRVFRRRDNEQEITVDRDFETSVQYEDAGSVRSMPLEALLRQFHPVSYDEHQSPPHMIVWLGPDGLEHRMEISPERYAQLRAGGGGFSMSASGELEAIPATRAVCTRCGLFHEGPCDPILQAHLDERLREGPVAGPGAVGRPCFICEREHTGTCRSNNILTVVGFRAGPPVDNVLRGGERVFIVRLGEDVHSRLWMGHDEEIARWSLETRAWEFYRPSRSSSLIYVQEDARFYQFTARGWIPFENVFEPISALSQTPSRQEVTILGPDDPTQRPLRLGYNDRNEGIDVYSREGMPTPRYDGDGFDDDGDTEEPFPEGTPPSLARRDLVDDHGIQSVCSICNEPWHNGTCDPRHMLIVQGFSADAPMLSGDTQNYIVSGFWREVNGYEAPLGNVALWQNGHRIFQRPANNTVVYVTSRRMHYLYTRSRAEQAICGWEPVDGFWGHDYEGDGETRPVTLREPPTPWPYDPPVDEEEDDAYDGSDDVRTEAARWEGYEGVCPICREAHQADLACRNAQVVSFISLLDPLEVLNDGAVFIIDNPAPFAYAGHFAVWHSATRTWTYHQPVDGAIAAVNRPSRQLYHYSTQFGWQDNTAFVANRSLDIAQGGAQRRLANPQYTVTDQDMQRRYPLIERAQPRNAPWEPHPGVAKTAYAKSVIAPPPVKDIWERLQDDED